MGKCSTCGGTREGEGEEEREGKGVGRGSEDGTEGRMEGGRDLPLVLFRV